MHGHVLPLRAEPRRAGWASRLSALGLVLAFGVTAYGGSNILALEYVERVVRSQPSQPVDEMLRTLARWKDTVGVGARARRIALDMVLARTPGDAAAIEGAFDEIAKNSPASVAIWQARATYQKARGAPIENVLPGFRMSALTGSHELSFMKHRTMFGLEHWAELPEAERHIVARDLVGSLKEIDWGSHRRLLELLAAKTEAEREEIRAAVMATGSGNNKLLQALGM
jgi:hypothetical protein